MTNYSQVLAHYLIGNLISMDPLTLCHHGGDLFKMGITFAGFFAVNSAPVACWKQGINHGVCGLICLFILL